MTAGTGDVVATLSDAAVLDRPPLVVLEPLERLLDELRIGEGPLTATPLGDGHSNVTYLLERGATRVVLRRPPRPPYAPSAHDVLREARLLGALSAAGLPVPAVLATVEDPTALGVPFVLIEHVAGHAISTTVPTALSRRQDARRIGDRMVDVLVAIHAVDVTRPPLAEFGKPTGYLERQLRRFSSIWAEVATRHVVDLDAVAAWLAAERPDTIATTLVHGDFRLGNMLYSQAPPARLVAVLDWEMATLGDPLADLGYLLATWAEPGDDEHPMLALSAATRAPGFPTRAQLRNRYAGLTGRDLSALAWYEVLALWKAAIFLEASYGRYLRGTTNDPYFATLREGVPRIAAAARARAGV
jgi:aminoglycoside phosphotransferase (APT) family kinase protein